MPKSLPSPHEQDLLGDISTDQKLVLISRYSQALRKLARSAEAVGRADVLPALIRVADGLESLATEIAETETGAEVMVRAARLIRTTEGMLASMPPSSIIH
ncbi:hypothetical protein Rleg4DRAFT_0892 [Rhizobium leguminosarum bv. trifolii WSM2297]|uniref:Uncharacterized protein n=1 Tax=Rhizobium leguminosarum bv. trifolii WSM2297 TaxID=754762 RepID=J0W0U6_RHILT|nr:hypothetical protein [Rhizobium leguminosarum]EJC79301.1 hypothetical protein Rleg4DRAFT_0892 [Rhizobium leguminosarum bv. trifolii WSM2297]